MAGLLSRLKGALTKTSEKISAGIEHVFIKKKLDEEALIELEEILVGDGGDSLGFFLDSDSFFGFDRLVQTIAPTTAWH